MNPTELVDIKKLLTDFYKLIENEPEYSIDKEELEYTINIIDYFLVNDLAYCKNNIEYFVDQLESIRDNITHSKFKNVYNRIDKLKKCLTYRIGTTTNHNEYACKS